MFSPCGPVVLLSVLLVQYIVRLRQTYIRGKKPILSVYSRFHNYKLNPNPTPNSIVTLTLPITLTLALPDHNGEIISPTSPLRLFSLPRQPVYPPWRRPQFEVAARGPRREIAYEGAKCPSGPDGK